jgi:Trypsin-like peptidase domain
MYQNIWKENHGSVCSIVFYGKSQSKLMGLTGFLAGKFIFTDDIIYNVKDAIEVKFTFYNINGLTPSREFILPIKKFKNLLPRKSEFDNLGIVVIAADFLELKDFKSLAFCRRCNNAIGKNVVIINYQFDQDNLAVNAGMISSYYIDEKKLSYLQFHGTIKAGISGSPVLDVETGVVIGVVTNRLLSMVKSYKELMRITNTNLQMLGEVEGKWQIDNIDLVQVLIANQNQIKQITKQFMNGMSIKVGFALEVSQIVDFLEKYNENDFDTIPLLE